MDIGDYLVWGFSALVFGTIIGKCSMGVSHSVTTSNIMVRGAQVSRVEREYEGDSKYGGYVCTLFIEEDESPIRFWDCDDTRNIIPGDLVDVVVENSPAGPEYLNGIALARRRQNNSFGQ